MNPETLLLRQVNPVWVQCGRVTSQAFRPTPKDQKRLSVNDGDRISPSEAYAHFTTELKLLSCGVQAVSVRECEDQELDARSDPTPDNPTHAVIDFGDHGENRVKRISKRLRGLASHRGWLYRPGDGS